MEETVSRRQSMTRENRMSRVCAASTALKERINRDKEALGAENCISGKLAPSLSCLAPRSSTGFNHNLFKLLHNRKPAEDI